MSPPARPDNERNSFVCYIFDGARDESARAMLLFATIMRMTRVCDPNDMWSCTTGESTAPNPRVSAAGLRSPPFFDMSHPASPRDSSHPRTATLGDPAASFGAFEVFDKTTLFDCQPIAGRRLILLLLHSPPRPSATPARGQPSRSLPDTLSPLVYAIDSPRASRLRFIEQFACIRSGSHLRHDSPEHRHGASSLTSCETT
ncbi:hypothetical protein DFH09DRAFT_392300 [Mycena vulgaris]|nr:hypothetical protein DFH09DRAFT_392300 [Mycena vulgaris]